ncbi:MAG: hypothetical protein ACLP1X_16230 [Polyangiaceae bacterium]|jgi:hypothetical protein
MTRTGADPTPSETPIVAPIGDVTTSIKLSLAQAAAHVAHMDPSATTQLLKLTIESHARTVDSWTARPPTDDRLKLVRKRVEQVLHMAKTTSTR